MSNDNTSAVTPSSMPRPSLPVSEQVPAARDALGRAITLLDRIRTRGGQWSPRRVQRLYKTMGYRGIPLRMSVLGDLDRLHQLGYLDVDARDPDRPVYTLRDTVGQEKTTPAGTAVTPGPAPRAVEAATLVALARALREQPTARQVLDGLEELGELGEAVLDEDAASVTGWIPALSRLLADHRTAPLGEVTETEVATAGHETVIADRIRDHCGVPDLSADQAAIEITAWHILPLQHQIAELEAQRERRRLRLIALQNDAMEMRGLLAPNGLPRRVPMPLGVKLAPAVDWLIDRVAALEAAAAEPVTDFRAEHESFPVGHYTNRPAAVAHIENLLVQEEGEAVRGRIVWSEPEDPDEEVPVWDVYLRAQDGSLTPTGYMVTAIPLAHEHDTEAEG
ncbi:hypothetical protein ACIOHE_15890 [Streptomyces sp. NPDC087851]|uniref:hypothetical protein n=1 Tax=Streptomyces sp. NPDC087851 TaxID=3365810 RepID=UPI00381B550C